MTPTCERLDVPSLSAEHAAAWVRIREDLRTAIGTSDFDHWCRQLKLDRVTDGAAYLSTPTPFLRHWVEMRYGGWLGQRWRGVVGVSRVAIVLRDARVSAVPAVMIDAPATSGVSSPAPVPAAPLVPDMLPGISLPLDPRFRLDTHIAGGSNALARAAALDLARGARLTPLYIHGATGLGKSHLLQGCAARARAEGREVVYLTASALMMALAQAARQGKPDALHALRDVPVLLIDDAHHITGGLARREFAALMRARLDAGMASGIAADRAPDLLDGCDDGLRSRLGGGLVAEILPMERELRQAYVEARMLRRAPGADPAARTALAGFIAEHCGSEGRRLEGAVNRIGAHARMAGALPDVEDARAVLAGLVREENEKRVRIADVQRAVTRHYRVSYEDLLSQRRSADVVRPRQVAMYLAKEMTLRSLPEIGRQFGGRDHTTVLHAVRKVAGLVTRDAGLSAEVDGLRRTIGGEA